MKNIHNLKLVQELFDRQMTGKFENKKVPSNEYIQCKNASFQSVRRKTKNFFLAEIVMFSFILSCVLNLKNLPTF